MGKFLGLSNGATLNGVRPEIVDIVKNAIAAIPYDAKIVSGERAKGKTALGNHDNGYAIDVQLYDNGKPLPNKGTAAYPAYEKYAQAARVYQQQAYPNLPLRTGLGFATVRGGSTLDPMHLDITPNRSMPYYNWDTGGTGNYSKFSNGGLKGPQGTQLVADYTTALKSGAPVNALGAIDAAVPRPMPPSIASAYANPSAPPPIPQPRLPGLSSLGPQAMNGVALPHGTRAPQMTPGQNYAPSVSSINGVPSIPKDIIGDYSGMIAPRGVAPYAPGVAAPTVDQTRAEQRRPVSPIGFGSSVAGGAGLTAQGAPVPMPGRPPVLSASVAPPVPMPGRPAGLTGAPPATISAPPPQMPPQAPPAPVAPPSVPQLRLASGKMIAPGIYNQGDHSVQVSDAGDGTAKITTIHGPMSVPGVIDPLREANADTIAGGMIRKMIPKVATDAMSSFNAPSAVDNVKSAALGAASNLGSTLGGFGSGITGAFSGLGGLFGGAPRPPVVPSFAQLQAMRAVPPNAYARPAPHPMQRPMNFYAAPAPQQQRPVVPMVLAPMAQGNGGGGFSNPSATYWSPSEGAWINN